MALKKSAKSIDGILPSMTQIRGLAIPALPTHEGFTMPSLALYLTTFTLYAAATGSSISSPCFSNSRPSLHNNGHFLAELARLHIDFEYLCLPFLWTNKALFFVHQLT